jgi:hypothetical protein
MSAAAVPPNPPAAGASTAAAGGAGGGAFADIDFASQLLASADPTDPVIQAALAQLANQPPPAPGTEKKDEDDADETGKKRKGDDM